MVNLNVCRYGEIAWMTMQQQYLFGSLELQKFQSPGCIAVAGFAEPEPNLVHCVAISLAEETEFEEQKVWSAPDSYLWACHFYQVHSEALHFVAFRQSKEESDWKPMMRILDDPQTLLQSLKEH